MRVPEASGERLLSGGEVGSQARGRQLQGLERENGDGWFREGEERLPEKGRRENEKKGKEMREEEKKKGDQGKREIAGRRREREGGTPA